MLVNGLGFQWVSTSPSLRTHVPTQDAVNTGKPCWILICSILKVNFHPGPTQDCLVGYDSLGYPTAHTIGTRAVHIHSRPITITTG